MLQEHVFEVENLNLYYGSNHALKNININIKRNEITAIIGPSGCGKSTFLKTLNRMVDLIPDVEVQGKINYNQVNIYDKDVNLEELRTVVGMVFQKPSPFPKSIYENIVFGPRTHGINKKSKLDEIVETSLKDVALWDEVKDRLHTPALALSGGQQQRLCIARCIAVEPDVILMDEPTSALDPISTTKIEELLQELKEKYSIFMVTHNMHQAARASDTTAFMLAGELIEFQRTEALFTKPSDTRTEDYIMGRFG
ncbi:phosphate ABC transporter ATP-binding protein PstB [Aneurinibacillus terranovensis]|uniref:phosphate ABC transporter ATP-binding protein PstB n=1 Tax=Aneurinibacillus terranovensis TaxID=278991 RepID=UPI0004100E0F|nr:phosphate ABC transporter ATP-binding protein PstB [Aneurinibacillus terranovensis]